jgi:CRISPR-associated protein Cas2
VAFVIAYDVCHPRRLRRVARLLERRGVRCQYSVFLFRGTAAQLTALLDELAGLIRPTEDVVQAWPVPPGVCPEEYARGAVRPVRPAVVILAGGHPLFVSPPDPRPDSPTPSEDPR